MSENQTTEECLEILPSVNFSDEQKYSILMMVAAACKQLYGGEISKVNISKKIILSIIEDLKIPRQVTKGVLTSFEDKDIETSMQPYSESLLKSSTGENQALPFEIIQLLLTATLKSEVVYGYDAHARVVILHVANSLGLKITDFIILENSLIKFLKNHSQNSEDNEESQNRSRSRSVKRGFIIGLTAISGGVLIGLTGGLAGPMIAAGAATIFGSSAAILGTGVGSTILGSLFGVAGAGLTGFKMKKRIGRVKIFEFLPLSETKQLHAVIAICGYLKKDENDFFLPWGQLDISKEQYTLKWEPNELLEMGSAIDYFISAAQTAVVTETLKFTALSGLMSAIAWPASLISIASILDNPWSVCLNRAQGGGLILADVIINRQHGCRPVTLIGFSSGVCLIYSCLKELLKRKDYGGIIQDVYIFGGPVTSNPSKWEAVLPVIAGRILNGYCKNDWILKFLFRFSQGTGSLAGLMPIISKSNRIQNFDLTEIINGHGDYYQNMNSIFDVVGIPNRTNIIDSADTTETKPTTQLAESDKNYKNDLSAIQSSKANIVNSPRTVQNTKICKADNHEEKKTKKWKESSVAESGHFDALSSIQVTTDCGSDSSTFAHPNANLKMSDFIHSKNHLSNDITTDSDASLENKLDDQYKRDSRLYHVLKPLHLPRKSVSLDTLIGPQSESISPIHKITGTFKSFFNFIQTDSKATNVQDQGIPNNLQKRASSTPDLFKLFETPENHYSNSSQRKK